MGKWEFEAVLSKKPTATVARVARGSSGRDGVLPQQLGTCRGYTLCVMTHIYVSYMHI